MRTGYLCGGINGLSDGDCNDWRQRVKSELPEVTWLDPMRRDYRGREDQPGVAAEIVAGDLEDLRNSDFILAMADRPSWGTAMEIYHFAEVLGRPVISVCGGRVSPWLREHSSALFQTLEEAIYFLHVTARAAGGEGEPNA